MEVVDLESKMGGNDHSHKRSDLEEAAGHGGDAKRPREGNYDLHSAMDMDDDGGDEDKGSYHSFELYRHTWVMGYGKGDPNSFDAETEHPAMCYTDIPMLPTSAGPMNTMEVFFVKLIEITEAFKWPLDVYGNVAVRDSFDNKRNYLFRRGRDNCQTLNSPQDSLLELTGPRRAVMLMDEPVFELDLKVKGEGSSSSEDKILCMDRKAYNNRAYRGSVSYIKTMEVSSVNSKWDVRFAHLKRSVEATIIARIIKGSGNFSMRLTACTSLGEEVVLLDSRGREVSVREDGEVELQRRVVVVEEQDHLILGIKAEQLGDTAGSSITVDRKRPFRAKSALREGGFFSIGSSRVHLIVAWSLLPFGLSEESDLLTT